MGRWVPDRLQLHDVVGLMGVYAWKDVVVAPNVDRDFYWAHSLWELWAQDDIPMTAIVMCDAQESLVFF